MTRTIGVWFFGISYVALCVIVGVMQVTAFAQVYGWSTMGTLFGLLIVCGAGAGYCYVGKEKSCSHGD